MTQSIPRIPFGDIHDPDAVRQGSTRETRVYYRPAIITSFIEKATGNLLNPATPELAREIRRRIALGEVEEKREKTYIATTPLPADAWHMNYYVKKGFKLWPPGQEPNQESQDAMQVRIKELERELAEAAEAKTEVASEPRVETVNRLACQVAGCGFVGKTFIGLARHMRTKHGEK